MNRSHQRAARDITRYTGVNILESNEPGRNNRELKVRVSQSVFGFCRTQDNVHARA